MNHQNFNSTYDRVSHHTQPQPRCLSLDRSEGHEGGLLMIAAAALVGLMLALMTASAAPVGSAVHGYPTTASESR